MSDLELKITIPSNKAKRLIELRDTNDPAIEGLGVQILQRLENVILLVDNNDDYRHTLDEFLTVLGYRVITAANPFQARNILASQTVDLIMTGVRLIDDSDPLDKSGLELAKQVVPQVPKIIMTAFPTVKLARDALRLNEYGQSIAVDFIGKNEIEVLRTAVQKALPLPGHSSPPPHTSS